MRRTALSLAALAPAPRAAPPGIAAIKRAAHDGYVAAIDSNDAATLMAMLTDDIVYQPPHAPQIVGKPAVRAWIDAYGGACRTHWRKTSIGFTIAGDVAFERYTDVATDTDRGTGVVSVDRGIFRRGANGRWRVAIDGWSSPEQDDV